MFPNCIDRFGRLKTKQNNQMKNQQQRKTKEKINK